LTVNDTEFFRRYRILKEAKAVTIERMQEKGGIITVNGYRL
jgi:chemotaxis methyl-accepting protein methylase